jgi:hypothetical protein
MTQRLYILYLRVNPIYLMYMMNIREGGFWGSFES